MNRKYDLHDLMGYIKGRPNPNLSNSDLEGIKSIACSFYNLLDSYNAGKYFRSHERHDSRSGLKMDIHLDNHGGINGLLQLSDMGLLMIDSSILPQSGIARITFTTVGVSLFEREKARLAS